MTIGLALKQRKRVAFTTHAPTKDKGYRIVGEHKKPLSIKKKSPKNRKGTSWGNFLDSIATVFIASFSFLGALIMGIIVFHFHILQVLVRHFFSRDKTH